MLIKEYRIPLPLSVEEYRIAQLYMIQKKSRQESKGAGSGVEILINRPYENGPGGAGQYTHKIYHIGSHMPAWFRAILPKTALMVEEESWNAYPYTRTRYTTPFIEKFSLDVETKYLPDSGHQENVFNLSPSEAKNRLVDVIDMVKDPVTGGDYKVEEDPKIFQSQKTSRGPLPDDWVRVDEERKFISHSGCTDIMCAYKLIRVEFRYWGMQNRIEKFIHDVALRKTMLHAHRQAWCWQDEWCDLKMEDIRRLEQEAAKELQEKMAEAHADDLIAQNGELHDGIKAAELRGDSLDNRLPGVRMDSISSEFTVDESVFGRDSPSSTISESRRRLSTRLSSDSKGSDQHIIAHWRMNSIRQDSESSDDEFYDAQDWVEEESGPPPLMTHWSSEDMLNHGLDPDATSSQHTSEDGSPPESEHPDQSSNIPNEINVLILVLHGGNVLDGMQDLAAKNSDINTFQSAFDAVLRAHFPVAAGRIAIRLVPCPSTCSEAMALLTKLSPRSCSYPSTVQEKSFPFASVESVPIGAIPILATSSPEYSELITTTISKMNAVYNEFLKCEEGLGFQGEVCVVGDCMGAILGYDALCWGGMTSPCKSNAASFYSLGGDSTPQNSIIRNSSFTQSMHRLGETSSSQMLQVESSDARQKLSLSSGDLETVSEVTRRRRSDSATNSSDQFKRYSSPNFAIFKDIQEDRRISVCSQTSMTSDMLVPRLEFEVTHFFCFGSPLALVLAHREATLEHKYSGPHKPACFQVYNLFHRTDPSAARLEPLIDAKFVLLPSSTVVRYQKFPLGNGNNHCLAFQNITSKWWGVKRLDYALYCPEALQAFPTGALPHLFHTSYWESTDVVAFMIRQIFQHDNVSINTGDGTTMAIFTPSQPREKWQRKRTSMKMKQSVNANHRGKDMIVLEGCQQVLSGRFMYSSWDMVTLTGEKVDIHIITQPPSGKWVYFGTEVTNSHGRVQFTVPESRRLGQGIYPVKMVVRGDHTSADSYLTVVPPGTECVVFSIDGSFTASVSIMGKDPKVRAGAVDIVRHWQELNYLIIYVTARPSMQKQKVVKWLAQHNFPHGVVSFCDSISTDPLRQKANYLRDLIDKAKLSIHMAYGSSKDIWVYNTIGLTPQQICIVGKVSKKNVGQVQVVNEGYAAHLDTLSTCSRPAVGNSRLVLHKGCFSLPGNTQSQRPFKQPAHRTASYGPSSSSGWMNKLPDAAAVRSTRTSEGDATLAVKFEV